MAVSLAWFLLYRPHINLTPWGALVQQSQHGSFVTVLSVPVINEFSINLLLPLGIEWNQAYTSYQFPKHFWTRDYLSFRGSLYSFIVYLKYVAYDFLWFMELTKTGLFGIQGVSLSIRWIVAFVGNKLWCFGVLLKKCNFPSFLFWHLVNDLQIYFCRVFIFFMEATQLLSLFLLLTITTQYTEGIKILSA